MTQVVQTIVRRLWWIAVLAVAGSTAAQAHVKWFAPYIVGAPPQSIGATLANGWFWTGIVLVLIFFLATRAIEQSRAGEKILDGMDHITDPLWRRLDDFVRVVIAAFFVAIFATGGVYLTPDLKTPAEWVSWVQLLIAGLIFFPRTQPLAAFGIIGLWLVALRDYDIFHLLDYLALGVGVAGYLLLEASSNPDWRKHRFELLRWGVAIALMWSSLEKFAYPDWFDALVDERPFLTFGLSRQAFVPMAGVAEFTMGFGMIWTPLVRRLSAIALFVIFNAAVFPFGRTDLIGHALIMAVVVSIAADHTREIHFLTGLKRRLTGVPAGLAAALIIFASGYWGLHVAIYGIKGNYELSTGQKLTHTPNAEHPHGMPSAALPTVQTSKLEDIYILHSIREQSDPTAGWCDPVRTGFEPLAADAERFYSFWSVEARPQDGRLIDTKRARVAEIRACFGPTNNRARQNFYAELRMGGMSFQGNGECLALLIDSPEAGLFPVRCQLILGGLPAPFIGGVLTTNTMTTKTSYGADTDPPGYTQASIATIRLWRARQPSITSR